MEGKGTSPLMTMLVLILALVLWLIFGILAAAAFYGSGAAEGTLLEPAIPIITVMIPYVLMAAGLFSGCRLLMKTPVSMLLSVHGFRFRTFLMASWVQLVLLIPSSLLLPGKLSWNGISQGFLINAAAVFILIPVQAVSEELFFRAIPLRLASGGRFPETASEAIPASIACGIVFAIPHAVSADGISVSIIYYLVWGFAAAMLASAMGGFEAVLGMHITTNIYIASAVGYPDSGFPTVSLFTGETPPLIHSVLLAAVSYIAEYAILTRWDKEA